MYGLCDCNNFYVSCERVFNPSLNGRPVVVLSNNDGCVIARSNEAKRMGIAMGEPFFKIRETVRKERIAVFSSNFVLYGDMSRRVMSLLQKAVPAIEVYSIDEAFLDFAGLDESGLEHKGRQIAATVLRHTGIPVSIGIAPTKTLAKIASKLCKQYPKLGGCCYMHRKQDIEKVLRRFPIEDVWGVGRRWAAMLEDRDVHTAWDFILRPHEWIRRHMGVVGLRMWRELQGEPCISFEHNPTERKHIATTRSFDTDISDYEDIHSRIMQYAAACARKLRKQNSLCAEITVFILTNRNKEYLPQYYRNRLIRLSVPTDSTLEIARYAGATLSQIFQEGYSYKRAGVILSEITPRSEVQQDLFASQTRAKHDRLMNTLDDINSRYGTHKLTVASQGAEPFKMHREHLSSRYTTDWGEIIRVKA